jgi:CRP-like cAMP-binding protein
MKNRILKALPAKEYRILSPDLSAVVLHSGVVLHEPGEVVRNIYFPNEAMVSYLSGTAEGETIEVGVVGNEGVVAITSLLAGAMPFRASVQIGGGAYKISRDVLRKEFARCGVLHDLLLRYANALLTQIAQTAVCNKFHSIEERFCRWLLMAHDRTKFEELSLTQDAMARILGTRRASVTVVAGALQRAGLIRSRRGTISLLDRKRLEATACECYQTMVAAYSMIYNRD